ncbi:hypothetical protein A2303_00695 [Candidatus Falkowbacteria bacterium RIFOXYB2_FULL_47_14]|uniref:Uncharacterized protein n=1 Tax=Candidatus Falkowbacteria bacterium RIFOXYA2_FULL_47_19 TaxID=1797994 RepID=A0A1F5SN15_9BACT|nr:MAG: hypothetical protein A2227_05945 [Candidatus Falkowbacteria bacterium RIFOXYA2_FULL_47_19]OGF36204.1 MAG: hypothetical protein A2468_06495 [Candidatus Falkowbacteria bacterium RIFOXYC2_FULL_46_15]OGF42889.1 MAG: hypothetical protein A2303_00695 [Candidatus Falkowbacteria bacterium RIFOXYB2_FULL_47_14]
MYSLVAILSVYLGIYLLVRWIQRGSLRCALLHWRGIHNHTENGWVYYKRCPRCGRGWGGFISR